MPNKPLLIATILLALTCSSIALADEIVVVDADTVWNPALDNATDVGRLVGEPGVMVVKYADVIAYKSLENATDINRLVGEPGVMVVRYADAISYKPLLANAAFVHRLAGDLNRDDQITPADAAIALQIAVSGGWDTDADVSGDDRVTSLDALMILQAAAGRIEL